MTAIHDNRAADLLGQFAARFLMLVAPPTVPVKDAKLAYYVEAGEGGTEERKSLTLALADYVWIGTRRGTLTALATTHDDDGEPAQQWNAIYLDSVGKWSAWR